MLKLGRAGVRELALAALALLVLIHTAGPVATAGGRGRDLSTCVQVCGSIKDICRASCEIDCAFLFPPGQDRSACTVACKSACLDEMQACKAKCNVNKEPPTGVEP